VKWPSRSGFLRPTFAMCPGRDLVADRSANLRQIWDLLRYERPRVQGRLAGNLVHARIGVQEGTRGCQRTRSRAYIGSDASI
jgi:hypothetical protein